MTGDGGCSTIEIEPGTIAYVPPNHAHRTVNTGSEELVFLGVYPADAGHDYESIEQSGFSARVVERDGFPTLVQWKVDRGTRG
jgi:glucose-6-phosphate isomerase